MSETSDGGGLIGAANSYRSEFFEVREKREDTGDVYPLLT